jgi:hypothetical protein
LVQTLRRIGLLVAVGAAFLFAPTLAQEPDEAQKRAAPVLELRNEALAAAESGRIDEALSKLDAAERLARTTLSDAPFMTAALAIDRAGVMAMRLQFEAAAALAEGAAGEIEALPEFATGGFDPHYARALASAASYRGSYGDCLARLTDARRLASALASRPVSVSQREKFEADLLSSRAALDTGDEAGARRFMGDAEARFAASRELSNDAGLGAALRAAQIQLALSAGDVAGARKFLEGGVSGPVLTLAAIELDLQEARAAAALTQARAALATARSAGRVDRTYVANLHYVVGKANILLGNYVDANRDFEAARENYEKGLDPRNTAFAAVDHALGIVHQQLDEHDLSKVFYGKAIERFETTLCPAANLGNQTRIERTRLLLNIGDAKGAEADARKVIAAIGQDPKQLANVRGYAWSSLGFALADQNRWSEAEPAFLKAFSLFEGDNEIDLPPGLTRLAEGYSRLGRHADARKTIGRALAIWDKSGASGSSVAESLAAASRIELAAPGADKAKALAWAQRAANLLNGQFAANDRSGPASALREHAARRSIYDAYVAALLAAELSSEDSRTLLFAAMQDGRRRSTAAAVEAGIARYARKHPRKAAALSKRRSLQQELETVLWATTEASQSAAADKYERLVNLQRERERLERELAAVSVEARAAAPEFDRYFRAEALPLSAARALLQPNEGLFLHYALDTTGLAILVTKDSATLIQTKLGRVQLREMEGRMRRFVTFGPQMEMPDFELLHDLYREHFGPAAEKIDALDRVIIVADSALQNIPAHMWIKAPYSARCPKFYSERKQYPDCFKDLRAAPWLAAGGTAFAYLPSVSALDALKVADRRGFRSLFGVADPRFSAAPAKATPAPDTATTRAGCSRDLLLTEGGYARSDAFGCFQQLPDTAVEMSLVAGLFGPADTRILKGPDASESAVRAADLAAFDLVMFATHAITPGTFKSNPPAIILSAPPNSSAEDDGLLTASEITRLDLNARLVVLSACSTAGAATAESDESFSGLARAFLFAGADNLLVSHWPVESASAARLTPTLIKLNSGGQGKARALLSAARTLINDAQHPHLSHPAFWGPFVIVGRGD